ncbi:dihydroorotate dehydrogenase [Paenibacillus sp. BSR1-1]|nr:dihydroorotate dehydrogenase [Paenibacillus sp. BSR1-1]MDN3016381.1 dihydroorotate dehydrogenase [Paenibacillus sp. BSR1-1]
MPDWSYHTLFKPLVSRLPKTRGREFIHRGMNMIASLPGGPKFIEILGHMAPSPLLQKKILGLTFSSPVGLSGKIDPLLTGSAAFSNLGFGFIEKGPISRLPNEAGKYARFSKQRDEIMFPNPLESLGMEKTIRKLEKFKPLNKPIFIRISSEFSVEELHSLLPSLSPYGDAIVLEKIFDREELIVFKDLIADKPILLSVQANQLFEEIFHLSRIDGIILEERAGNELTFSDKQKELIQSLRFLKSNGFDKIPIILSGGVLEPEDALELYAEGADLIMLSGGYVLSGPGLPKRINEAFVDQMDTERELVSGWIWYWLFGLFITIGGILALLFSMTTVILPNDEAFLGFSREELMTINPNFIYFMAHDRMTLAGTMVSGGILYMQLARHGVKYGIHWARKAINIGAVVGFLGILLFFGFGYFDWLHGLFWVILFPFYINGVRKTKKSIQTPISKNRTNHPSWKKSLWGQLCFVVLGFAFIIGGVLISMIGATNVFVPTDLGFICMTPGQMNDLNSRLIPLIAHDRAGFGSALLSVGLLVIMIALWGFHQGEKWVWNSLLIGGVPAFGSGIITHFVIGYTTFIHLLPAYFALFLFVIGLTLSRQFFYQTDRK